MKKMPVRSYSESLRIAEAWCKPPFDADTQNAVRALLDLPAAERENAVVDHFGYDLEFGTAGMRALMDVGTARINAYTIARVSAAVAEVLQRQGQTRLDNRERPKVVVGYDGRKNSRNFAVVAVGIFLKSGLDVAFFDRILPTPIIPFAVRRLEADCGIVITSSHNTAPYNGFKVYNAHGAQIISPFDTDVMAAMTKSAAVVLPEGMTGDDSLLGASPSLGKRAGLTMTGTLTQLDEMVLRDYVAWAVAETNFVAMEKRSPKIVFTPLHGAAGAMMNAAFYRAGFKNFMPVPQQYEPRPDFATVKAPNPENKDSLAMAIAMAREENADLILATDGDGDRVGVAYRTSRNREQSDTVTQQDDTFVSLSGNQIGTLFLFYLLTKRREARQNLSHLFALSSVVSTPLTRKICDTFGIRHIETLTGFKNMGNQAQALLAADGRQRMVLAFEEAFGVTIGDSRDKDGIVSCLLAATIASDHAAESETAFHGIAEWLERMYSACGYAAEDAVEKEFSGTDRFAAMRAVVEKLRQNPPAEFLGSPVVWLRDFQRRMEIREGKEAPITEIPAQNLLYFMNAARDWFALRPSGTEPKLKAYVGVQDATPYGPMSAARNAERLTALCRFAAGLLEA